MVNSISSMGQMPPQVLGHISRNQPKSAKDLAGEIDTNGDGSISATEFVSNRPKDVSQDQAEALWKRLDASGVGSLAQSEFISAMESQKSPKEPPSSVDITFDTAESSASPADDSAATDNLMKALMAALEQYATATGKNFSTTEDNGPSLSDLFSKINTNGDGSISKDEFISNRPEEMSEDQATQMWAQLDTENNGSLTEEQFSSMMHVLGSPPGPPPQGGFGPMASTGVSSETQTASSSDATISASDELVKSLLAAIKQYSLSMAQTGSSITESAAASNSLSTVA